MADKDPKKDPAGPTKRPERSERGGAANPESERGTHAVEPMRARMPTASNEDELEIARLRSMSMSERPTPNSSASLLSLANAYAALTGSVPPPSIPSMPAAAPELAQAIPADLEGE